MKILMTNGLHDTSMLLQALVHANDHEITHCADGARAIAELLKNGCDWAIIDGRAVSGGEMDFARIIRMMGPDHPENRRRKDAAAAGACADSTGMPASCGVEWSKGGILQLHCAMHSMLKATAGTWPAERTRQGEILFEYHAPCNKGRQRDG